MQLRYVRNVQHMLDVISDCEIHLLFEHMLKIEHNFLSGISAMAGYAAVIFVAISLRWLMSFAMALQSLAVFLFLI